VFDRIDRLLEEKPEFVVVSVPRGVSAAIILELASRAIPVLAETPPAADLAGLVELWRALPKDARVEVAEQYAYQPLHAARLAFIRSGKLGDVHEAQISVAHGYHGVALIRKYLNIGFENAWIEASEFKSSIVAGPNRNGPPAFEKLVDSEKTIATLRFGDKFALFDFTSDQYFSWIRSHRVLVRGTRGEIANLDASYLIDYKTPMKVRFQREDAGESGSVDGNYHRGYLAGMDWWYQNPFAPCRLSDDEIAIATCLELMSRCASTGESSYSLAEASQDHYLSLLIDESATTRKRLESSQQPWGRS
jgi:hypothetical protein